MKRTSVLLLFVCLIATSIRAESSDKPSATIKLSSGSVAAGIGFSWGGGTLTYKGKSYAIGVKGLSIGKVGISEATATGKVYNLHKLQDFDGNYAAVAAGIAVAGGGGAATMQNQNGVRIELQATTRGVDLTVGGAGVDLHIKK